MRPVTRDSDVTFASTPTTASEAIRPQLAPRDWLWDFRNLTAYPPGVS